LVVFPLACLPPPGGRGTSKCRLGDTPAGEVEATLRASVRGSLERMRLDRLDLFFLHCNVVPDDSPLRRHPEAAGRMVPAGRFRAAVRPALERLVADGTVGAWGLLAEQPQPAAVQCIANLLDSPGGLKFFDGPARPRELIGLAVGGGIGVMGIRAVQAGALTDRIDRPLAADHPEMRDFARAAGFRRLAADLGTGPAALAHRYALSIAGVDTVVLGVKNRAELADCIAAAEAGPLPPDLIARIDAAVPAD
jgi:aryl-alcohol dehydrogenase-like predicted oxidoreductase